MKRQVMRGVCRREIRLAGAALAVLALFLLSFPVAHLARADSMAVSIPADIGANEHWVDVNISYWQPDSIFGSTPTSHGCVGMELADSKFLWDYLKVGSRIVIHS